MNFILCDIGDTINFDSAGENRRAGFNDLQNTDIIERIYRIQFHKAPTKEQLKKVVQVIDRDPRIELRFYGDYSENLIDWNSLGSVRRLSIDLWRTESLEEIKSLTGLKSLALNNHVQSKVSLKVLENFKNLETLFTSVSKDVETICNLQQLKFLSLRAIKARDLSFISNLKYLEELWLSLGSYHDFHGPPATLKKLSVHQVKGINDEAIEILLEKSKELHAIELQNIKRLENIDFMKRQSVLSFVSMEGLKNLRTLKPLGETYGLANLVMSGNKIADQSLLSLVNIKNIATGDSYPKEMIRTFVKSFRGDAFWYKGKNLVGEMQFNPQFIRPLK